VNDWRRERARERFAGRCAYCGVHEEAAGALLTLDHHQPRSRGGADDEENLVYACPRCNEHKGAYWHAEDPPHLPLLHPGRDDLASHVREDPPDTWRD
jgi:5-methylcytosine-specific restriction endonuclease McrA